MSVFGDMVSGIQTVMQSCAGLDVSYRRRGLMASLTAVPGKTDFELMSEEGFSTRFESRDWLVIAAELVLNDEVTKPRKGDQIVVTIAGEERTYEVMRPDDRDDCYSESDHEGLQLRIHTKRVK